MPLRAIQVNKSRSSIERGNRPISLFLCESEFWGFGGDFLEVVLLRPSRFFFFLIQTFIEAYLSV